MELDNPESWEGAFEAFITRFASCYQRAESSSHYVRGLLADKVARKNCWQPAEELVRRQGALAGGEGA